MRTPQLRQTEINQVAWNACDTFRGVVDPAQYKDYILVMLFLKYISDVWKDHYGKYKEQFGGDDERIRRRLERERFVLPEGTSFYDLFDQRNESDIGDRINIALDKIEKAGAPTKAIKGGVAHLCIADPLGRNISARPGLLGDLFATHPPMAMRVARLRGMAFQAEKRGGDLPPE